MSRIFYVFGKYFKNSLQKDIWIHLEMEMILTFSIRKKFFECYLLEKIDNPKVNFIFSYVKERFKNFMNIE